MTSVHCTSLAAVALIALGLSGATLRTDPLHAQAQGAADGAQGYTVFLQSRPIGREEVAIVRQADGWIVRGSNRLGPPIDAVTRVVEVHYDSTWKPLRFSIDGTSRGQDVSIKTTFAEGEARNEISVGGTVRSKTDAVAADTVVLPNGFFGSYAALARRLVGAAVGATFRAYILPQGEVPIRVEAIATERIETPQRMFDATRFSLVVTNPPPGGDVPFSFWIDSDGAFLRMSVPAQTLEIAREDIASAATRTAIFSLPGDETVRIQSAGFNIAATVTKPSAATRPLPAIVLIGGSGPTDRDGLVAGIPILGQMARHFSNAGFFVVRYDKRGVGQSGGRTEASTIADYSEDVRAIVRWLDKRKDVDKKRIGLVGHSEGAWVAMLAAARENKIDSIALIGGAATTGAELILAQQLHQLTSMKVADAERQAKIELQKKIQSAVVSGTGWDLVPPELRKTADTPWFQSFLSYDPARVMKDVRQPVLIVQPALDTQVPPHHGEQLAALARARKRKVATDVAVVPNINHLLVPAKTGEVDEYASLAGSEVSPVALAAISTWMAKNMTPN
jgi:pimeloyl-ACP methyl ester carboxylesterase